MVQLDELGLGAGALDQDLDVELSDILGLASRTLGVPQVSLWIVDAGSARLTGHVGLGARSTPRELSLCELAVAAGATVVVADARVDERLKGVPAVTGHPDFVFYAAAPVRVAGHEIVGSLCVMDTVSRDWRDKELNELRTYARVLGMVLLHQVHRRRGKALAALAEIAGSPPAGLMDTLRTMCDVASVHLGMPSGFVLRRHLELPDGVMAEAADWQVPFSIKLLNNLKTADVEDRSDPVVVRSVDSWDDSDLSQKADVNLHVISVRLEALGEYVGSLYFWNFAPKGVNVYLATHGEFLLQLRHWASACIESWLKNARLIRKRAILDTIARTQSWADSSSYSEEDFRILLEDILAVAQCPFGFIAERHLSAAGDPYLRTCAISNIAWDGPSREMYEQSVGIGMIFTNPNTLFGPTMTTGELVIANDPETDPRAGGTPGKHPTLECFLGMPLEVNNRLVGMLALANRAGGFTYEFAETLEPLCSVLANMIVAAGVQQERLADQKKIVRLSTIAEQLLSAAIAVDLDGRISWVNEACRRMFSDRVHEIVDSSIWDFFDEVFGDSPTLHDIREVFEDGTNFVSDVQTVSRVNVPTWLEVRLLPLREDSGAASGFAVLLTDVSERRRIDQAKTDFIATVSHELRTPLTSISGSLRLIEGGVWGELPEDTRRLVTLATNNCRRLALIIDDLLDIEGLAREGVTFVMTSHDLVGIVSQSVRENEGYVERFGCRLEIGTAPQWARVECDRPRVLQVLANLISNAAKFSPADGLVLIDVVLERQSVRVEVRDHGKGVPPEFRGRLFERFAQADDADTRLLGGSGLGLSIAQSLIEGMGGSIGYHPADGHGSVFWFTLPLVPVGPGTVAPPDEFRPWLTGPQRSIHG